MSVSISITIHSQYTLVIDDEREAFHFTRSRSCPVQIAGTPNLNHPAVPLEPSDVPASIAETLITAAAGPEKPTAGPSVTFGDGTGSRAWLWKAYQLYRTR